jgi:hypothetical protein
MHAKRRFLADVRLASFAALLSLLLGASAWPLITHGEDYLCAANHEMRAWVR